MNDETKSFIKDLKQLCNDHDVYLDESDQYGGDESFLGTEYTFIGKENKKEKCFKIWLELRDLVLHI